MATEVNLPALGESVTEGTVTRWLKQVGDEVAVDEPLLEVSTDKVDTEIPSPVAGTLLEIKAHEDDTVEVGAVLAVIGPPTRRRAVATAAATRSAEAERRAAGARAGAPRLKRSPRLRPSRRPRSRRRRPSRTRPTSRRSRPTPRMSPSRRGRARLRAQAAAEPERRVRRWRRAARR